MNKDNQDQDQENQHEQEETLEKPSYTYWKREHDKPFSEEFKPIKNDKIEDQKTDSSTHHGSAWNKAGTWEEKHIPKTQFEEFFSESLKRRNEIFKSTFTPVKIFDYSGDVKNKYLFFNFF